MGKDDKQRSSGSGNFIRYRYFCKHDASFIFSTGIRSIFNLLGGYGMLRKIHDYFWVEETEASISDVVVVVIVLASLVFAGYALYQMGGF